MRGLVRIGAAACAAAMLLTAGCSGAGSKSKLSAGQGDAAAARVAAGGGSAAKTRTKPAAATTLPARSLVKTATLTVRVTTVNTGADDAINLATKQGGDVLVDSRAGTGKRATADLSLEVPPNSLEADLNTLAHLGEPINRDTATTDVTQKVVDVNSRLSSMRTSLARVRALYAKASSITAVIRLESEVTSREADLESLEAQQLDLSRQTAYATIDLHLRTKQPAPIAHKKATRHAAGVATDFHRGWHAFTATMRWALAVFGGILPFLLLFGAAGVAALWWRRTHGGRVTPNPPPTEH